MNNSLKKFRCSGNPNNCVKKGLYFLFYFCYNGFTVLTYILFGGEKRILSAKLYKKNFRVYLKLSLKRAF